eukprot:CAMPEP_0201547712 /NCGR_PEP_ID=MMETSP0173_2-20130828/4223_1 /ASSEMBLY_ACC=CAM_ASM_000268 /TAXON_ID=218659 /ORGANISM="Vexillifera sp., Strain DIVA3 564/2" /LENGTH=256 /DNA_ID=CAMNT_0047956865 /DNA_START=6 /DNA_END=773 /DNA_ORIENTATION=+
MSTWKNVVKGKTHKERSQPKSRRHLGLLEKKQDYRKRARDYHQKQKKLKLLNEKASTKNPDEFYPEMLRSKVTQSGEHRRESKNKPHTHKQIVEMKRQDYQYLDHSRQKDRAKIEKLSSQLQFLDDKEKPRSHVVFLDNKKACQEFDEAEYFQTLPELVERTYNRPKIEQLCQNDRFLTVSKPPSKQQLRQLENQRAQKYAELSGRMKRKERIEKLQQQVQTQRQLMTRGRRTKRIRKNSDGEKIEFYEWKRQRKK